MNKTRILPKATASLQQEASKELNIADPDPEVAKAILEGSDEDTRKNKRKGEGGSPE